MSLIRRLFCRHLTIQPTGWDKELPHNRMNAFIREWTCQRCGKRLVKPWRWEP